MRFLILILLPSFTLVLKTTVAQVPGYQGKKTAIYYNLYASPAFKRPNLAGKSGPLSFNYRHAFSVDFVRARRRSIGLTLQLLPTNVNLRSREYKVENNYYQISSAGDTSLISSYSEQEYATPAHPVRLNLTNIGIYWKFFKKGYIAPWGQYHRIDLILMRYQFKEDNAVFDVPSQNTYSNYNTGYNTYEYPTEKKIVSNLKQKNSAFQFAYSFGKQRIVSDKLILDFGIQFGIVFKALKYRQEFQIYREYEYVEANALNRLGPASYANFTLGLGFLAF